MQLICFVNYFFNSAKRNFIFHLPYFEKNSRSLLPAEAPTWFSTQLLYEAKPIVSAKTFFKTDKFKNKKYLFA